MLKLFLRALSSEVEQVPHKDQVEGSIPSEPTHKNKNMKRLLSFILLIIWFGLTATIILPLWLNAIDFDWMGIGKTLLKAVTE